MAPRDDLGWTDPWNWQIFAVGDVETVRQPSGRAVRVYSWWPVLTYSILYRIRDEHFGGRGNVRRGARRGAREADGRVVRSVRFGAVFCNYEHFSQELPTPDGGTLGFSPHSND
ncbi:uncharacterized protein BXZ73DRAFT_103087 [Epithele typhae]|uniref:uncharacterized protein n=1 Tax=Epithele typhae TaxID=378194 RepID=UPI0020085C20|nr:uncharacterized protein BXZ73DRAFT_103087 [Epithele typhae]KAH9925917.1 hypothetical protein BXZ73DRAFT_103087 [Epithele typhae]